MNPRDGSPIPLSPPERGAEMIAALVRRMLDHVFTVELPRTARSKVLGEPVITMMEHPQLGGRYTVSVTFEMEHRQI